MRWLTRSAGISLSLLLVASMAQALAPRTRTVNDDRHIAAAKPPVRRMGESRPKPRVTRPHRHLGPPPPRATLGALRSDLPVRGPISSEFGARRSFWRARSHTGVDIVAKPGTPVRAPIAGTVTYAGWRGGYGRTIILDHGGEVQTLYGHLSRVEVSRGQRVAPRDVIGLTGATGHASGPHLHYEILARGRPIDPRHPDATAGMLGRTARAPRGPRAP